MYMATYMATGRTANAPTNEPEFTQTSSTFAMTCEVAVNIRASAEIVWSLLSDAKGFSRWNSTVTRSDGEIREGAPQAARAGHKPYFHSESFRCRAGAPHGVERWRGSSSGVCVPLF